MPAHRGARHEDREGEVDYASSRSSRVAETGVVVHIEDVPVTEVWKRLSSDAASVLIDVRTRAEWAYVGLPDLSGIGKQVIMVEWQTFPDNRIDPGFVAKHGRIQGVSSRLGCHEAKVATD